MADRRYLVKVERKVSDIFRVEARSSMEAYAKVYGALAHEENGDGLEVALVSHTIISQNVKQPRQETGDDAGADG